VTETPNPHIIDADTLTGVRCGGPIHLHLVQHGSEARMRLNLAPFVVGEAMKGDDLVDTEDILGNFAGESGEIHRENGVVIVSSRHPPCGP
jgi:hypothetical protein